MSDERYEAGMRIRREVLGDAHVDRAQAATTEFTAAFQDLITRFAWGTVWAREGLDRRTRSAITLAVLAALGRERELELHVHAAVRNGLTDAEIAEVLLHTAVYAGVPRQMPRLRSPSGHSSMSNRVRSRTMAMREEPPFRADHVGSLLRPPELLKAREEHAGGRIDDAELRAAEDDAIREVVKLQRDVGLRSATDGEFRRASWHMDFIYSLDGVSKAPGDLKVKFHNEQGDIEFTPAAMRIDGKLGVSETIFGEAFEFLRSCVSDAQRPKLTIPSPSMVHYRGGRASIEDSVYPDMDAFWSDLTAAYREEVRRLGQLGCTYLQFDDTSLAYLNDPKQREHVVEIGGDAEHQHEAYIAHINEALSERPEGMSVTTHMCRGNFRSSWVAEGGYDFVAEALFNELQVDGFFMEWDDARSGGFEPLRFVPKNKVVVLGLVTTKRGELEDRDLLKRRIEQATQYVDLNQLCLSPQCGFSSTVEGNVLSREQQADKLRLIVELAEEVWG